MDPKKLARRIASCATLGVAALALAQPALASSGGGVFTESNEVAGNAVVAFDRGPDGSLTQVASYLTGGTGLGSGLGSQGALASDDGWLLAVNAGSNDVSVFRRRGDSRLQLVDREPSGGVQPISVTIQDGLVYVLNAGAGGNIAGFRLGWRGDLRPIAGASQPLSTAASGPAQVSITPDGDALVVTEKATKSIDTYALDRAGRAAPAVAHASSGATPFGFAFGRHDSLIVSEAGGGANGTSAVSSYDVRRGRFTTVSASSPTFLRAACWVATTRDGRFAYTTNAASDAISGFAVARDGSLTLLNADGVTGAPGAGTHPTDASISRGDRYLYTLDAFTHQVSGFQVAFDGHLAPIGAFGSLPATAAGLIAR